MDQEGCPHPVPELSQSEFNRMERKRNCQENKKVAAGREVGQVAIISINVAGQD